MCMMKITVAYSMKRIYPLNCFNEAANHVCDVSLKVLNNLLQQKLQITNIIKYLFFYWSKVVQPTFIKNKM